MLEVVIIGAGPAGLTAAIYLGRFHRPPLVIDSSASRARWIPRSHNILGFPHGIGGPALLTQLRAHAERYGARIRQDAVQNIVRCEGGFELHLTMSTLRTRFVVLATGDLAH